MVRTSPAFRSLAIGAGLTVAAALCAGALLVAAPSSAPVADAAQHDDLATVKSLVRGGAADVNAAQGDGLTALHWAAINDDAPLAEVLLYAGADVDAATR